MERSKVQLSAKELELVQNGEWILTKQAIIARVYELFGALADDMRTIVGAKHLSAEDVIQQTDPKISKGEVYQQLPWVVLDFPRVFGKDNVFAIRTFFWWSHYFSITLHLKGKYQQQYASKLDREIAIGAFSGWFLSTGGDEWNFDLSSYRPVTAGMNTGNGDFVKLSWKIAFDRWNTVEQEAITAFEKLILSCLSSQSGETDPSPDSSKADSDL